jgi:hypothetical protein
MRGDGTLKALFGKNFGSFSLGGRKSVIGGLVSILRSRTAIEGAVHAVTGCHTSVAPCVPQAGSSNPAPPPFASQAGKCASKPCCLIDCSLDVGVEVSWWLSRCRQALANPQAKFARLPRLPLANGRASFSQVAHAPSTRTFLASWRTSCVPSRTSISPAMSESADLPE